MPDPSPSAGRDTSQEYSRDASLPAPSDASPRAHDDTSPASRSDRCRWCRKLLNPTARRDSIYCCKSHRQAAWRFGRALQVVTRAEQPLRLAVADPPYPGLARKYYQDHPDYQGEVDHEALLSRLQEYDGWALCTSAEALPWLLALCVSQDLQARVAIWVRGVRKTKSRAPLHGWEAVIYHPAREVVSLEPGCDVLIYHHGNRLTDPDRVVGAKPAPYIDWVFSLLQARPGDQLDDLFPGSGGFTRAWSIYNEKSLPGRNDTSRFTTVDACAGPVLASSGSR